MTKTVYITCPVALGKPTPPSLCVIWPFDAVILQQSPEEPSCLSCLLVGCVPQKSYVYHILASASVPLWGPCHERARCQHISWPGNLIIQAAWSN